MAIKPILFSTPMMQAIKAGRKTQTRRIIKSRHESGMFQVSKTLDGIVTGITSIDWDERPKNDVTNDIKPIAVAGDILWVRETWTDPTPDKSGWPILYKADFPMVYHGTQWDPNEVITLKAEDYKWKPSIFMPKEAARIFLKVTNVRAERLQDITDADAIAEGLEIHESCNGDDYSSYPRNYLLTEKQADGWPYLKEDEFVESFKTLWQSINGRESWESNRWVWVYEFEQIEKPKDFGNG